MLEDNLLLGLSRLEMSRIVPIFHDYLGLSRLHFGLTKGSAVELGGVWVPTYRNRVVIF